MSETTKSKYRVLMPVSFEDIEGGRTFLHGEVVELDLTTAVAYQHALAKIEEGE